MAWNRVTLLSLGLVALGAARAAEQPAKPRIDWQVKYPEAVALAAKLEKPVLIDFFAAWCGPCRMMEEQTFTDPEVITAMGDFVCVKVDVDTDEKTAFAYGVRSIPRTVVLNIHGEMVGDRVGFMESSAYMAFLKDVAEYTHRKVDGTVIKVPMEIPGPEPVKIAPDSELVEVMKYLADPAPAVREQAREILIALDAKLVEGWMRQALASKFLGERIAAKETLAKVAPEAYTDFDPWATEAERTKALVEGN